MCIPLLLARVFLFEKSIYLLSLIEIVYCNRKKEKGAKRGQKVKTFVFLW
nr:MAG TPA: hypothetical protein [Caudoviricetes sp.]